MSISVDDIGGPDAPSFKFEAVGDTIKGVVTYAAKSVRESRYSGKMEETLRIVLDTEEGEQSIYPVTNTNVDGDGWATRQAKAIAAAIRVSGADTLEIGGTLAVKYSEEIPTDKGNPAKGYQAQYKPPTVSVADTDGAVSDLI